MKFKVGDKVRIIRYEEALEVYKDSRSTINFGIFKSDGDKVVYINEINYGDVVKLSNGKRCLLESLKINKLDMELNKNLFEL